MTYWAYVSNDGSNEVQVIDLLSLQEVARISVPPGPFGLALSPDHDELWLPLDATRMLASVETATGRWIRRLPLVDPDLVDVCIDPDGTRAFLLSARSVLYTVDVPSSQVLSVRGLGGGQTERLSLSPEGTELWVADELGGQVAVVSLADDQRTRWLQVGTSPADVAFTPDGAKAYVPDLATGTVHVIDRGTGRTVRAIAMTGGGCKPRAVALSATGAKAYVTLFENDTVAVIDTKTDKLAGAIEGRFDGPNGIAVSPGGDYAVVVNQLGDRTSIISLQHEQEAVAIPFPGNPRRVVIGRRPPRESLSEVKEGAR